eukprot:6185199-Pleurochrysis_carterae.AAC.1
MGVVISATPRGTSSCRLAGVLWHNTQYVQTKFIVASLHYRAGSVGGTSTVHRYGRGATSVLRASAVRASRLRIRDRMN